MHRWVNSLVLKCRRQDTLDVSDLYEVLPEHRSATLTDLLEKNWFAEIKQNPNKPSLIRATLCTMRWKPFLIGLLLIPLVKILLTPMFVIHISNFIGVHELYTTTVAYLFNEIF